MVEAALTSGQTRTTLLGAQAKEFADRILKRLALCWTHNRLAAFGQPPRSGPGHFLAAAG